MTLQSPKAFSDNDLKRLKEHLAGVAQVGTYPMEKLIDLLARLEAAEKLCNYLDGFDDVNNPIVSEYLKAWRKSKGEK